MSLKKTASKLFSYFPGGLLKDKIRVFLYNLPSKKEFHILKKNKKWVAVYPDFDLKFSNEIEPYHVLSTNFLFTHYFPEKPVDILVDAGSYIGSFSLYAKKRYNNIGKIIALEPDPKNFKILQENIKLNNLSGFELFPVGLWSRKDTLTFYSSQEIASSVFDIRGSKDSVKIEVDTLDNLLKDVKDKRIFFKMNIEGSELEALNACSETIKNNKVSFAIAADHIIDGELTQKRVEDKCASLNLSTITFKTDQYITVYASNEIDYNIPESYKQTDQFLFGRKAGGSNMLSTLKKKRILYISNVNLNGSFLPGVIHKIKGQEKAFHNAGFDLDILYPDSNNAIILKKSNSQKMIFKGGRLVNVHASLFSKLIQHYRLSRFGSINFKQCFNSIVNNNYGAIYLRFYLPGRDLILFLSRIKKVCPGIIILLEYPTSNVKNLFQNDPVRRISYAMNHNRINKLNKLADYFITLTREKILYGKPAIFMPNGIELEGIDPVQVPSFKDQFVLLGIASGIHFFHGFDKIIRGLSAYAAKEHSVSVYVRLISNPFNKNLDNLKKLVKELKVDHLVSFELPKTRSELKEVYKQVHVGVGTLALHRAGLMDNYSLKHREYAAFGLPFIMSKGDFHFENSPFVMVEERNEEPVEIQNIVDFYRNLRLQHPNYPQDFRKSVENWITWEAQMKDVFEIINDV